MTAVNVSVQQGSEIATLVDGFTYSAPLKIYTGNNNGLIERRNPDTMASEFSLDVGGVIINMVFTDGFLYAIYDGSIKKLNPDDLTVVATSAGVQGGVLCTDSAGNIYAQNNGDDLIKLDKDDLTQLAANTAETSQIVGASANATEVYAGGYNDLLRRMAISDISVVDGTASQTDIEAVSMASDGSVVSLGRDNTLRKWNATTMAADGSFAASGWSGMMSPDQNGNIFIYTSNTVRKVRVSDMTQTGSISLSSVSAILAAENGFLYVSRSTTLRKHLITTMAEEASVSTPAAFSCMTANRNTARDLLGF